MIKVRLKQSDNGKTLMLTVQGHAGQADIGHDIVCSSASILAYTAAQIVQDLDKAGKLKNKPTIRLEKGDCCITCKPTKDRFDATFVAFTTIQVGYALLAHNYPDFVHLVPFGESV